MINLIPSVKKLEEKNGFLKKSAIYYDTLCCDKRIVSALSKLPFDKDGAKLTITVGNQNSEEYEIWINEENIEINATGSQGAFYAVQTLRQLFKSNEIPCLYIKDFPDFEHRAFYHDVTRGKVPTVETVKKLVDTMAYYKMNSLQLYVEHTAELKEYSNINSKTGFLTNNELKEIDSYCKENFIEFIPSLSTFGHLYELLEQDEYKHLCVLKDYKSKPHFWEERMQHHTIDPLNPESFEVIKSLIDQYAENFESDYFNICCDETFDLENSAPTGYDAGKLYVDFVKQLINHLKQKGKKIMMWADILLKHPECIEELPQDTYFLNWYYNGDVPEKDIAALAKIGKNQIVCPGTSSWNRFCENFATEEENICKMAEYGYKYGAKGILNTNWGDWGNPCSLELAMYGLVLGAEKSWAPTAEINDKFYNNVNVLLYENPNGIEYLKELSSIHSKIWWGVFCNNYFDYRFFKTGKYTQAVDVDLEIIQSKYQAITEKLNAENGEHFSFKDEMLSCAEGLCVMAELNAMLIGEKPTRITDTREWLSKYRALWLSKNKESELHKIEEMFMYLEENL